MSGARAMILAAGRGQRMRPLTDTCPKPLLIVRGKPLIEWHLEALARGGFDGIVVNTDWLGSQISGRYGRHPILPSGAAVSTSWSDEGSDFGGALETAGGIARALPLLDHVFWVLAGDIFTPQFEFSQASMKAFAAGTMLAHLWLVPNPDHNPRGDFGIAPDGRAVSDAAERFTYSTVGLYRRDFFASLPFGNPAGIKAPLAPMLRSAMDNGQVSAELYRGAWTDVGTPARLAQLNQTN